MCKRKDMNRDNIESETSDGSISDDESDVSMAATVDSNSDTEEVAQDIAATATAVAAAVAAAVAVAESSTQDEDEEEEEEEDEVIKAILAEKQKVREHPPDIKCEDFVTDICFHPQRDLIVAATVTGDAILYKYTNESVEIVDTLELHMKACRDVEFSDDGTLLFSTSKDKAIMISDVETGKLKKVYENSHSVPVYSLHVIDENLISSGDDDGTVKLWDLRQEVPIFSLKEMEDYVSCMITNDAKRHLVCASGDGSVTTLNINSRKLHLQSENYDTEFTSVCLMRSDTKLAFGSSKGAVFLFNWGEFGYHSDEFPGPKQGINSLVPITENVVVTACEDGILRAVHLFPHRHLGVVGQHQLAVESVDISNDGHLIASFGHDHLIKFWNIKYFEDVEVDEKKKARKKKDMAHNLPSSKYKNPSDFFSGLAS